MNTFICHDYQKKGYWIWKNLQNRGEQIILRYVSRWAKARMRGYLQVTTNDPARHMADVICPCQFIENHLKYKPTTFCGGCIPSFSNENHLYPY